MMVPVEENAEEFPDPDTEPSSNCTFSRPYAKWLISKAWSIEVNCAGRVHSGALKGIIDVVVSLREALEVAEVAAVGIETPLGPIVIV
jgi:hypothetical protein